MKKKTTVAIVMLSFLLPSLAYARHPTARLMNLYDPNTEIMLEGWALASFPSGMASRETAPAVVPVALGRRVVMVILGPTWYVKRLGIVVKRGQRIRVIGSKAYGPNGQIYVIARKVFIPKVERIFIFRNKSYIPGWKTRRIESLPPR